MWVELKNKQTGQGEHINLLQITRCMKGKEDTVKITFADGEKVVYDIVYKKLIRTYEKLWRKYNASPITRNDSKGAKSRNTDE